MAFSIRPLPLDLELNWYWLGIIQYPQPPAAWREVMRTANRALVPGLLASLSITV